MPGVSPLPPLSPQKENFQLSSDWEPAANSSYRKYSANVMASNLQILEKSWIVETVINYIIIHNITHFQVLKWKAKIIIITGN